MEKNHTTENIILSPENRKNERKRKRFTARLKSSKGIICTDLLSSNILLCNVGQATEMTKDFIIELINKNALKIALPKYIAEKGETYSYLSFECKHDAEMFLNKFNYRPFQDGKKVFMSYIECVPVQETVCSYENPNGLSILHNFITEDEERKLIEVFDWYEESNSNLRNRQVKHYGYEFRYGSNDVDLSSPLMDKIPNVCDVLWERLKAVGFDLGVPDQLTVNKYYPGNGIPSHVDKHSPFRSAILSLSLGSSVVMDWKHHSGKYVPTIIPARSMLVMQDEARYDWQHGIQSRNWDPVIEERTVTSNDIHKRVKVITTDTEPRKTRISLTFRWTRSGPCCCSYKTLCDSFEQKSAEIDNELASNLENLHVHQVYEQIAGHFSTTRHKPWPKVVEFMEKVQPGSVVLDLGCGNGKNVLKRYDILQIAGERSKGLLSECKHYIRDIPSADCVRLDLLNPGIKDECADIVICIAVIHHFSSKARRLDAISKIAGLLRIGGKALITVWAKDQTKSNYLCKNKTIKPNEETHVNVNGLDLPVHENRTQFQHNDLLVPWKLRTLNENKLSNQPQETLLRYYHVFENNELLNLCNEVPALEVVSNFYEEGNWCVVCKKH